jgi:hypothetical protein
MVDREFGFRLLSDPEVAMLEVELLPEEREVVGAIRASTLAEFAQKLEAAWSAELVPVGGACLRLRPVPVRVEQWRSPLSLVPDRPLALHLTLGG